MCVIILCILYLLTSILMSCGDEELPSALLRHPFTMRVVGGTMSGKSYFVRELLKRRQKLFDHAIPGVLYCYGSAQPLFEEMKREDPHIVFHEGLPEQSYKKWLPQGGIVVLDDLMDQVAQDPKSTHLFTKGAHHDSLSPISIEQNMFPQGRGGRTQRINTQYRTKPVRHFGACNMGTSSLFVQQRSFGSISSSFGVGVPRNLRLSVL